ncbi:discoidin domain-containing protein [Actinomadura sp. 6N118]|uniref:discoidin domain-containing protein n=1 Tax=Actinomadura sp. 6N118 TaxID=3375151 RepID=UPI00378E2713
MKVMAVAAVPLAALTAVVVAQAGTQEQAGTRAAAQAPVRYVKATVDLAAASSGSGSARYVLDDRRGTRWSANGTGQWLRLDLGTSQRVSLVKLAFHQGNTRRTRFDLQTSADGKTWRKVWSGRSSGTTLGPQTFDTTDVTARYVRYLGRDQVNAITEAEVHVPARAAKRLSLGADGRLVNVPYPNQDQIPDFSRAGYGGGGVALPTVPVRRTVTPPAGGKDAGAAIQSAIDAVSGLAPDAAGFRGAVLLKKGTYNISGQVLIRTGGVVLRGEGDGSKGTVLRATGTSDRTLIKVAGSGQRAETPGSRRPISGSYIPVGARSLNVSDASAFNVGDNVVVVRTPNQEWIDSIGMDACKTKGTAYDTSDVAGQTCLNTVAWTPASRTIHYERRVTAKSDNRISLDSPVVEAFQAKFGGGAVYAYGFPGRIAKVGVENLRAVSSYASNTDEKHAGYAVNMGNVEHAWVRNVTSLHFIQGTFFAGPGARYVTVQDSASLDHKSQITGGRRYPFSVNGASHVLVMRVYASTGRHDFVTGANTPGPNVFLDSRAEKSNSELGPHHRWATGSLFDNVVHNSTTGKKNIGTYNRADLGTGHGWSGAYQVFYNCLGDTHKLSSPPGARNWSIGCRGTTKKGTGEYDAFGGPVAPWSLYLQQLRDRLGTQALRNIGY